MPLVPETPGVVTFYVLTVVTTLLVGGFINWFGDTTLFRDLKLTLRSFLFPCSPLVYSFLSNNTRTNILKQTTNNKQQPQPQQQPQQQQQQNTR
eukprot:Awhi_evm1s14069